MLAAQNPIERLRARAAETPDAPWLYQSINGVWSSLSYAQVADQVLRMGAAIKALGIPAGSAIGIGGRNTAHWVMADLAIAAAGCVSVGLYPKQSVEHLQYILKHCEAKAVFVGPMIDAQEFMDALPKDLLTIGFPYPDAPKCKLDWSALIEQQAPLV